MKKNKLERYEEEQPPFVPERAEDIIPCCSSCEYGFIDYDCEWYCEKKAYKVRNKFKPERFYKTHKRTQPYYICRDFEFFGFILKERERLE